MKMLLVIGLLAVGLVATADERERENRKGRENEARRERDGATPSIERIMKAVHGKNGMMKTLDGLLKAQKIDWPAVQANTKKILPLAVSLGKRKPDRGAKESWKELTEVYADFAKELDAGAAKKDAQATKDAFDGLNTSCTKCHDRHREKGER